MPASTRRSSASGWPATSTTSEGLRREPRRLKRARRGRACRDSTFEQRRSTPCAEVAGHSIEVGKTLGRGHLERELNIELHAKLRGITFTGTPAMNDDRPA